MTRLSAEWKGLKGARSGMAKLTDEAAVGHQAAIKSIATSLRKEIRSKAPSDHKSPRRLPKNIRVKIKGRGWNTVGKVSGGRLAHLVEYPTKAHVILPEKKRAMRFSERFASRINHPGTKGQPFFWPTVKARLDDINRVNEELGSKIVARVVEHIERDA